MHTLKGKGFEWAEQNKEAAHWASPGLYKTNDQENHNTITSKYLLEKIKKDKSVVVVSPATPGATGLTKEFRKTAGKQYIDVGIAEEHAVAFISGFSRNGGKPVLEVSSSFIQRAYDQLSQDLALNNSSATILVFGAGIDGGDATHVGMYDIAMISNIPNIVCLAPTSKEEYLAMLDWSIEQNKFPVVIRVPENIVSSDNNIAFDESKLNKSIITIAGNKVAIIGLGNFYVLGESVVNKLKEHGINATLINHYNYSKLDTKMLDSLKDNHELVVTLEDGILDGGFGQKIASHYGTSNIKVLNFGGEKEFNDLLSFEIVCEKNHLNINQIVKDILNAVECSNSY